MNSDHQSPGTPGRLETRTIDMVPEHERHGSPWHQLTLWFGANLQITAVVDGALAVLFGVEALTAIIGLLVGNIFGGAVMALHAAQGPRLGLPQMISSRVQFGVKGAALPLVLVIVMYLGFAATGTVLSGQAINNMLGSSAAETGIVIFGALSALMAIAGYRVIHMVGRISSVISIAGFAYLVMRLFSQYDVASAFGHTPPSVATFLLAVSLSAGWQLTFAPYVADYSRYLPSNASGAATFWSTFTGTALGAQIAMTFGVLVAACAGGGAFLKNQVGFMGTLAGPVQAAFGVYLVIVAGKLTVNCLNTYGGFMSIVTTLSAFTNTTKISPRLRALFITGFVAASMALALAASADFLNHFKNFVLVLLAAFVPWSAINLVDYYLVSKERVDIPALYDPAGRYGAYNWMALGCYVLGIVVQVPFLNQKMYQGVLARQFDGADISWLVSLAVTAAVYYPLARKTMNVPHAMIFPADAGLARTAPAGQAARRA